jgi:hypothetical protein
MRFIPACKIEVGFHLNGLIGYLGLAKEEEFLAFKDFVIIKIAIVNEALKSTFCNRIMGR